ncbi:MAG TPA: GNAT family N-acetyltransferase [Spirochaetia bacterium]|nr:GNAT family N-acetyltransferase [Spirochaetia bacterium]
MAFRDVGVLHDDPRLPPLVQTYEGIVLDYEKKIILKYTERGRILGSVRGYMDESKACHIGRLMVHPDYQNRGIGTRLMEAIEGYFDHCSRYRIFTGNKSENSLHLYRKLDYGEVDRREAGTHYLVYMQKENRKTVD